MDIYYSFFVSSLFLSFAYVAFEQLVFFSLLVPGKKPYTLHTHTHSPRRRKQTCHHSYLLCVPRGEPRLLAGHS